MQRIGIFVTVLLLLMSVRPAIAGDTVVGPNCDLKVFGKTDKREFLAFDNTFRTALKNEDAAMLASVVFFPLSLNYGQDVSVSIDNPATLQAKFNMAFPPEVRDAVLNEDPTKVWCSYQGIMYGNGAVWANDIGKTMETVRFVVESVNLPESISDQPLPKKGKLDFICNTAKHQVIVDEPDGAALRYRAWKKAQPITDKPDMEIDAGVDDFQGTGPCAAHVWEFKKGDTEFDVSELGCTGDPQPPEGAKGELLVLIKGDIKQTDWCY